VKRESCRLYYGEKSYIRAMSAMVGTFFCTCLPLGITLQCVDIIEVKDRRYFIMDCLSTDKEMEV
jgi:hypothetical protein